MAVAAAQCRQVHQVGGAQRERVVAIAVVAVVGFHCRNALHVEQTFEQASQADFAKRMRRHADAAQRVDARDDFMQRQVVVAAPSVPAIVFNAIGQQVSAVGGDFNTAQHQQTFVAPHLFHRLRGLVGVMLGDADGIYAQGLGAPDQIDRLQPVVIGVLRMAMGVDPHGLNVLRCGDQGSSYSRLTRFEGTNFWRAKNFSSAKSSQFTSV